MEYIITFKNTAFAIKAEKSLLAQKLTVGVLPLPTQISAGCGICLRVKPDDFGMAVKTLGDGHVGEIGLFSRQMENGRYAYKSLGGR